MEGLTIELRPHPERPIVVETALYFLDNCSFPLADSLQLSTVTIGTQPHAIYLCSGATKIKISDIFISSDEEIAIVRVCGAVPNHLLRDWCRALSTLVTASSLSLIMDAVHDSFGHVKHVTTTIKAFDFQIPGQPLAIGNVITGCGAALLNQLELSKEPAVMFLCPKDLAYSVSSAKQLELLIEFLNNLGISVDKPDKNLYQKYVSSDPFLINTSNLYV
jgi:hypothetical protein